MIKKITVVVDLGDGEHVIHLDPMLVDVVGFDALLGRIIDGLKTMKDRP